jgi:hypothetical protein
MVSGVRQKPVDEPLWSRIHLLPPLTETVERFILEVFMVSAEKGYVEIASVLVNPEIFTRPYTCDVVKYNCRSMCCYRSCIVTPREAAKVEAHLDGILAYLSPENREAVIKNGSVLGDCSSQCPTGCVIHEDEARAIRRNFGNENFRCVLLFNNDCSLIYTTKDGQRYCSVHSYAFEKGLVWEEFKFTDCVQYPLAFYTTENGQQVLSIQETPHLNHIRCMTEPYGEPMYKSLRKTIETYLGAEFYRGLEVQAEQLKLQPTG